MDENSASCLGIFNRFLLVHTYSYWHFNVAAIVVRAIILLLILVIIKIAFYFIQVERDSMNTIFRIVAIF